MQVPNGAVVKYQGTWPKDSSISGLFKPIEQTISDITAALTADGLPVLGSSTTGTGILSFSGTFDISLTLQNNRGMAFGSEQDVVSIINHEVFAEVGSFPQAGAITSIQSPNQVAAVPTLPPGTLPAPPAGGGGGVLGGIQQAIQGLADSSQLVIVGLGIGLIAAVLLISRPRMTV